jgi:hypothetical protein
MSNNLIIYDRVRSVPDNAKKPIKGGRLKGMTDISPMWRIKKLTEEFGPCGFGWKYTLDGQWSQDGADGAVMAFCNINLYIKKDGEWSEAIPGTGGAMLVAKESGGLYSSDEAFKMALTDALSVACKAIGMGADVYWDKDSKYDEPPAPPVDNQPAPPVCRCCGEFIKPVRTADKSFTAMEFAENTGGLCLECYKQAKAQASQAGDSQ